MIRKKKYVCTPLFSSHGFTLLETIMTLTVLSILLSFCLPILKLYDSPAYTEEMSAFQYFTFIQDELNTSKAWTVKNEELLITDPENRLIKISKYNQDIRRQVNGTGHELLLQQIISHSFIKEENQLIIRLSFEEGRVYEKVVYFPKE
ncbi:competence type IV pilus minor pilin ComGF [Halobacillus sp. Marseille-Q1614]|uniref:competence type IV pilus minor pilin ComGF n=1 Tax=Halobacillus sp. Marseille-Q1614 TaxID=2709134 RepID=UPI00156F0785|nr:competence type IV pilus minor pilin ComGF [Halobacillus sp. Marseille-Q1614]